MSRRNRRKSQELVVATPSYGPPFYDERAWDTSERDQLEGWLIKALKLSAPPPLRMSETEVPEGFAPYWVLDYEEEEVPLEKRHRMSVQAVESVFSMLESDDELEASETAVYSRHFPVDIIDKFGILERHGDDDATMIMRAVS